MIEILLVDDHPMVRKLLRQILQRYADLILVGEAQNGEDAVAKTASLRPTVVLIDVNLPSMNGIEATKLIKVTSPSSAIIGLTAGAPGNIEEIMIAAGAAAVVDKGELGESLYPQILKAVRQIESPAQ